MISQGVFYLKAESRFMYFVTIQMDTKLKPRIPRISAKYLDIIDDQMRQEDNVSAYNLGVLWSWGSNCWGLYAWGECK